MHQGLQPQGASGTSSAPAPAASSNRRRPEEKYFGAMRFLGRQTGGQWIRRWLLPEICAVGNRLSVRFATEVPLDTACFGHVERIDSAAEFAVDTEDAGRAGEGSEAGPEGLV